MSDIQTLNELKTGDRAYIIEIHLEETIRRRLWDLGLVNGAIIEKRGESPLGDPAAFIIKNTVLAIRKKDGKKILVKRTDFDDAVKRN